MCLVYFLTNDFLWTIFSCKLLIHWGKGDFTNDFSWFSVSAVELSGRNTES